MASDAEKELFSVCRPPTLFLSDCHTATVRTWNLSLSLPDRMGMPGCPPVRCQWRTDYCQARGLYVVRKECEAKEWHRAEWSGARGGGVRARAGGRRSRRSRLCFRSGLSRSRVQTLRPSVRPSDRVTKRRAPVVRLTVRPRPSVRLSRHARDGTGWHGTHGRRGMLRCGVSFVRSFVLPTAPSSFLPFLPFPLLRPFIRLS